MAGIARLLVTIDADGDASNGITVPDEMHAILAGIQIDLEQTRFEFDNDLVVRRMRRDGLAAGWGAGRPIASEPFALYAGLAVPHDFCRVTQSIADSDAEAYDALADKAELVESLVQVDCSLEDIRDGRTVQAKPALRKLATELGLKLDR